MAIVDTWSNHEDVKPCAQTLNTHEKEIYENSIQTSCINEIKTGDTEVNIKPRNVSYLTRITESYYEIFVQYRFLQRFQRIKSVNKLIARQH